jgi:glycosyltransferase involved in cell wall biosynthesis
MSTGTSPCLSIVTPAHREGPNLPVLHERLVVALDTLGLTWEWIVVDDHSPDDTFSVVSRLATEDPRVRGVRFSRNCGSHTAIACGLDLARGDSAVIMAADLQDPPEALEALVAEWRKGAQIVWAVRGAREGEKASTQAFARLYYAIVRRFVGIRQMPATGADFFLIDRVVIEAVRQFNENNASIFVLLSWMGFRQTQVLYVKNARLHGRSSWGIEKKIKLVLDSITSFTYLPIRLMSYLGIAFAILGFLYAIVVVANAVTGRPPQGWSSLAAIVLVMGGIQMLMMGMLGEYLWRSLEESRRRPRYLIEAVTTKLDATSSVAPPRDEPRLSAESGADPIARAPQAGGVDGTLAPAASGVRVT